MLYQGLAYVMGFIALILCFVSLRMLFKNTWFMGFIRGTFGLSLLAAVSGLGLISWEFYQYNQASHDQEIATLSITQKGNQQYQVEVIEPLTAKAWTFNLAGDQWQLDARIIRWGRTGISSSFQPGYRLDRISGRYYSLEDETNAPRTVHNFADSTWDSGIWKLLNEYKLLGWVDARYGSATFVPLADGAIYSVSLSHTGLLAKPVNPAATEAVERWN
ncbi:MAG: cation/multidrug efflux pump [Cellvibrionaceae bacterium]